MVLCGAVCDFRLQYGNSISRRASLVVVNKSPARARQNRKPLLTVSADPALFLLRLSTLLAGSVQTGRIAEGQETVGWFGEHCKDAAAWMRSLNEAEEAQASSPILTPSLFLSRPNNIQRRENAEPRSWPNNIGACNPETDSRSIFSCTHHLQLMRTTLLPRSHPCEVGCWGPLVL